jgi:predicted CDP-diglyceride synthetase/phosphatidate cytidylyltransferase
MHVYYIPVLSAFHTSCMNMTQCYNAGGILDRVDSYVFTGALCYSFVRVALPLYGV